MDAGGRALVRAYLLTAAVKARGPPGIAIRANKGTYGRVPKMSRGEVRARRGWRGPWLPLDPLPQEDFTRVFLPHRFDLIY